MDSTRKIFEEGVSAGHLAGDFRVVGARDVIPTGSPGSILYRAIQQWEEYDHENQFSGMSCEEIYNISDNERLHKGSDKQIINNHISGSGLNL